jgi:hypothetical protein
MKRFLSLLALVVVPGLVSAADAAAAPQPACGYMDHMKNCFCGGPVSPRDDTWLARTDIGVDWQKVPYTLSHKHRHIDLWSINTLQPLWRGDDLHNTLFTFMGTGISRWNHSGWNHPSWNIGVGYRYLTNAATNMFGIGVAYNHMVLNHIKFHGPAAYVEWLTQYTTLTLQQQWDKLHVTKHAARHFLHHKHNFDATSLDLSFQVPFLPWAQINLGRSWFGEKVGRKCFHSYRHMSLDRLDYGLRLNLLGCLALEGGFLGGWDNNGYVRLVLSLGRPASNEFTLMDGFYSSEAFSARDLKAYTLAPVARNRIDTLAMIK